MAPPAADHAPAGYQLVFADEFSTATLDRGQWCTRFGWDGGAKPQVVDQACVWRDPGGLDFLNDEFNRQLDLLNAL